MPRGRLACQLGLAAGLGACPSDTPGSPPLLAAPLPGDPRDPAQGAAFRRGQADAPSEMAGTRGDKGELQKPAARSGQGGVIARIFGHGRCSIGYATGLARPALSSSRDIPPEFHLELARSRSAALLHVICRA
jgi:hypothetical protein